VTKLTPPKKPPGPGPEPPEPPERTILVEGFDVHVTDAGRYILTMVDGKAMPVTVEEYKERLAAKLVEEAPTLETFRTSWISPSLRKKLLASLPDAGRSPFLVRSLEDMSEYDLYDVLGEIGYGMAPRKRAERADAFTYKHATWLTSLPAPATATLKALTVQFARTGTEGLENPQIFRTPEVSRAGGLAALKTLGKPAEILNQTKEKIIRKIFLVDNIG
jgi:type I restriction enzyme R subunit